MLTMRSHAGTLHSRRRNVNDKPTQPGASNKLVGSFVISATLLLSAEAALALLIQLYLKDLGASPLIISLSSSLSWVGTLIASPVWGGFSDRVSSRRLLGIVLAGSGLATYPLAFLPTASVVLLLGVIRRFAGNGLAPIGMKLISDASPVSQKGRNLSFLSAARAAGFVFGGILGGILLERLGFRMSFLIVAGLPMVATLCVTWIPRTRQPSVAPSVGRETWHTLRHSPLGPLYIGVMLRQLSTTGVGALAFVYMAEFGISSETMGIVSAINPTIAVASTLVCGALVDRIDRRLPIVFGFVVATLYPLGYAVATGPVGFAFAAVPLGLSFGSYYSGTTKTISAIVPQNQQGAMFGLLDSSRGLGGLLGPIAAGILVTGFGYRWMFLCMAAISAMASLLVMWTMRTVGRAQTA